MAQADSRSTTPKIVLPYGLPTAERDKVEDAIERLEAARDGLIAFLDAIDGDPDREPSLGERVPYQIADDLEVDCRRATR